MMSSIKLPTHIEAIMPQTSSGCFCITLAKQNPHLRCAVMDLKPMCEVALDYVRAPDTPVALLTR
jgi:hypothetical protein